MKRIKKLWKFLKQLPDTLYAMGYEMGKDIRRELW